MKTRTRTPQNRIFALSFNALVSAFVILAFAPLSAFAEESCATDIETQFKQKATMGMQKQIVQKQTSFNKTSGSIVEIACFDKMAAEDNQARKVLFSEGTQFVNKKIPLSTPINFNLPSGFTETAIAGGFINAAQDYVTSGFSDSILGGLSGFFGGSTGGKGQCDTMKNMQHAARSMTVLDEGNPFPTLRDLAASDPRKGGTGTGITNADIDASEERRTATPPTHLIDFIARDSDCAKGTIVSDTLAIKAVATGRVKRDITYYKGSCVNPACTYKLDSYTDGAKGTCL